MFSSQQRKAKILFSFLDVFLTLAALVAAYYTRLSLPLEHLFDLTRASSLLIAAFTASIWIAIGHWLDIYGRISAGEPVTVVRDALAQTLYGSALLVLFEFLIRLDLSRAFLAFFALYCWVFLAAFRLAGANLAGRLRREAKRYVMIVGTGTRALTLAESLETFRENGVQLRGFFTTPSERTPPEQVFLSEVYPVFPLRELPDLLSKHVIDEIHFAVHSEQLANLEDMFYLCDEEGVRTRIALDFFPHVNSRVRLEELGRTRLLTFSASPDEDIRLLAKRMFDVVISVCALALLSPLTFLVAALIKMTSRGPVIFRQERCGLNGRRFTVYKFRSMCADAEERYPDVAHLSQRELATKIPNDPRLTTIGGFLRRFSIDEIPQFFNVLRGDMSLVGPRPAIPSEVARYQRWQRRRLRMRPGLTCLWALNGRDQVDFESWMRMDMQYIDNWSLGLDWKILLRTIPQVLSGRGAS